MIKTSRIILVAAAIVAGLSLNSCKDTVSYAELLNDETFATNAFLANHRVVNEIPADSVFETGPNAPYYRMDEEGNIYMQVIKPGDRQNNMAVADQLIYFRFTRYNLKYWYENGETEDAWIGDGNADNLDYSAASFRYGNYMLSSSSQWGTGIQLPLAYLGIDCEVNIVIKSQLGFVSEVASVIPYMYNVRYFKSMV